MFFFQCWWCTATWLHIAFTSLHSASAKFSQRHIESYRHWDVDPGLVYVPCWRFQSEPWIAVDISPFKSKLQIRDHQLPLPSYAMGSDALRWCSVWCCPSWTHWAICISGRWRSVVCPRDSSCETGIGLGTGMLGWKVDSTVSARIERTVVLKLHVAPLAERDWDPHTFKMLNLWLSRSRLFHSFRNTQILVVGFILPTFVYSLPVRIRSLGLIKLN